MSSLISGWKYWEHLEITMDRNTSNFVFSMLASSFISNSILELVQFLHDYTLLSQAANSLFFYKASFCDFKSEAVLGNTSQISVVPPHNTPPPSHTHTNYHSGLSISGLLKLVLSDNPCLIASQSSQYVIIVLPLQMNQLKLRNAAVNNQLKIIVLILVLLLAERSGSKFSWFAAFLVLAAVAAAGVAGYIFYKYRLRVIYKRLSAHIF